LYHKKTEVKHFSIEEEQQLEEPVNDLRRSRRLAMPAKMDEF
jgi:hypothetical protein